MSRFTDVPPDSWYADAVERAASLGMLTGYPDGTFKPDQAISRKEMAVILDRLMFGWHDLINQIDAAMVTVLSPWGRGSGTHIGDGLILTNHHVVARRKPDGDWEIPDVLHFWNSTADPNFQLPWVAEAQATYLFGSSEYDLAVLQRTNYPSIVLPSVPLASSNMIRTGEEIIVIGSPYGLIRTVTRGIISHPARYIDYYDDGKQTKAILFQTDAPINPGNSGGAAVNRLGHLLGVPSARYTDSDGLGFCIRIDSVVEFLKAHGIMVG